MITDLLHEDDLGHVQAFLVSDIKDEEHSARTIEGGDIRQGAARGAVALSLY